MPQGSCVCGAVWFEFDSDGVIATVACFCTNCRKVSGSQFGVYLQVRHGSFRWLLGEDNVAAYESSPGNKRGFCKTCGCVAPIATYYGAVRIPGGALDADPGIVPDTVIFEQSKAEWCTCDRASHRFMDSGPPEFWSEVLGKLHGSG